MLSDEQQVRRLLALAFLGIWSASLCLLAIAGCAAAIVTSDAGAAALGLGAAAVEGGLVVVLVRTTRR